MSMIKAFLVIIVCVYVLMSVSLDILVSFIPCPSGTVPLGVKGHGVYCVEVRKPNEAKHAVRL